MPRYPPSEQPVLLCLHSSWTAGQASGVSCTSQQRHLQTLSPMHSTAPWKARRTRSRRRLLLLCWWSSSIPTEPEETATLIGSTAWSVSHFDPCQLLTFVILSVRVGVCPAIKFECRRKGVL